MAVRSDAACHPTSSPRVNLCSLVIQPPALLGASRGFLGYKWPEEEENIDLMQM